MLMARAGKMITNYKVDSIGYKIILFFSSRGLTRPRNIILVIYVLQEKKCEI